MVNPVFEKLHKQLTQLDAFVEIEPGRKGMAVFFSGRDGMNKDQAMNV